MHMDRRKLRNKAIPDVIKQQGSELSSFDMKLAKFGGTLVSDGKDDVCRDHLINYVIVCLDVRPSGLPRRPPYGETGRPNP